MKVRGVRVQINRVEGGGERGRWGDEQEWRVEGRVKGVDGG